jgi:predicted RNase H-like nuclease
VVSGSRYSSIFDVPCRAAIQASDHEIALQRNKEHIGDDSLGPQKWGFSERIHEADVFMRRTDTEGKFRESHPEVCFAALTPDGSTTTSKKSSLGQEDRLNVLQYHEPKFVQEFHRTRDLISEKPAWQRRVGVGMVDDIVDAMVLAYTARVGSLEGFTILGGETDSEDLPMEIVYYNGCTVMTDQ